MGRQPYLNKIGLGRSAFEPCEPGLSNPNADYIQLTSARQELPPEATVVNRNKYVQIYDERGNPINPRAHEHGRTLREAQNDVLASIGAVERRRSPSHDLQGSNAARLQELEDEDMAGNAICLVSTAAQSICTWWIGSLRARVLTFRYHDTLPFSRIIALESSASGKSILHAGLESFLLSTISVQSFTYAFVLLRPLDRLVIALGARSRVKRFYRRWREYTKPCVRIVLELIFYPFIYHSYLQRVGLKPSRPFFPPWRSFIAFSKYSPLNPFFIDPAATSSVPKFLLALLTSPFALICLKHTCERWVNTSLSHLLETAIIHPDCPDLRSADQDRRDRLYYQQGLRKSPPRPVRTVIEKIIGWLGWAHPVSLRENQNAVVQQQEVGGNQAIEMGGTVVTNLNHLDTDSDVRDGMTASSTQIVGTSAVAATTQSDVSHTPGQPTPPSPTASHTSQSEDNDPRIRITSREGIVEMEVRLPAQIVSQRTELVEVETSTPGRGDAASPIPSRATTPCMYHRVTQLSTEPSQMLAGICKAQIVAWVTLPLAALTRRSVVAHYLATGGGGGHIDSHGFLPPVTSLSISDVSWTSMGWQVSRIALCASLDLAVDLTLWGCSYVWIVFTGTNSFGWGTL